MSIKVAQKYFTRKMIDFDTFTKKCPKNVGDLGKLIAAKGFNKFPKVQLIAQSGHTANYSTLAFIDEQPLFHIKNKIFCHCDELRNFRNWGDEVAK